MSSTTTAVANILDWTNGSLTAWSLVWVALILGGVIALLVVVRHIGNTEDTETTTGDLLSSNETDSSINQKKPKDPDAIERVKK